MRKLIDLSFRLTCEVVILTGTIASIFGSVSHAVAILPLIHAFLIFVVSTFAEEDSSNQALPHMAAGVFLFALANMIQIVLLCLISFLFCIVNYFQLVCWRVPTPTSLHGYTFLVTGASAGIGEEVATQLLDLGAVVLFGSRSIKRGLDASSRALARTRAPASRVHVIQLDVADCDSIKSCAATVSRDFHLNGLICNAGGMFSYRSQNNCGWENNMAVNALGHHFLASLLLPDLEHNSGRIVTVSSSTHKKEGLARHLLEDPMSSKYYSPGTAYASTKLAQLISTYSLQNEQVDCVCVHPGNPITQVTRDFPAPIRLCYAALMPIFRCIQPSVNLAGATVVNACFRKAQKSVFCGSNGRVRGGMYIERCLIVPHASSATDNELVDRICELFDELIAPYK